MATLVAHMTELEAVNQMLRSIGESGVNVLNSGQIDAAQAQATLAEVSRRIQAQGWHANTRRAVSLPLNASGQFVVGVNALSVDTVNVTSGRRNSTPSPSSFYNVMLKRSADDTKYLLYDVDNDTEVWTTPSTMTVDIVEYLKFTHLPLLLQTYIYKAAAHEFQKSSVSSQVLFQFTKEDVDEAQIHASQEDSANEDNNILRDSPESREVLYRNNPLYT